MGFLRTIRKKVWKRAAPIGAALTIALSGMSFNNYARAQTPLFQGDGSDEPGFVPPPAIELPSPPPKDVSGAQTYVPGPPPPVTPMSRTEAKKPPRPAVVMVKLRSQYSDWNSTPNDVNNLLAWMKAELNISFDSEIKSLEEIVKGSQTAPIRFRTGHYHFSFSDLERKELKDFMLNGGMLIFDAGLGSQPFYDSAIKELKLMFPELPTRKLYPGDPIFHSYYNLDRVDYLLGNDKSKKPRESEPQFEGVTINCRNVAVVTRGMALGWQERGEEVDYPAHPNAKLYSAKSAKKLGMNLIAYALAEKAANNNSKLATRLVDSESSFTDKMFISQIVYPKEWKTRHAGLSILLNYFNLETDIPVKLGTREVDLSSPALYDCPMLYLTGHGPPSLSKNEMARLRNHILSGGFLFAEACCGSPDFDLAFKEYMNQTFPDYPLEEIPRDHDFFKLRKESGLEYLTLMPALAATLNSQTTKPILFGIKIGNKYHVVYSPVGITCSSEGNPDIYAKCYDPRSAIDLAKTIFLYAITD